MKTSIPVTGIILAGGRGRRMGGVDKGLQLLNNKPMIDWVIERFSPQVQEVLINANQNQEQYRKYGYEVIADRIPDFAGPLAGLHAALFHARHPLVATVPCDSPFLPADLIARLYKHFDDATDIAVAKTFDQPHPVFCLCRKKIFNHLSNYLENGGRKIDAWYAALRVVEVQFDDEELSFRNINTLDELKSFSKD
jgi:molybdopterin-guanine dinucleotide biosynthesis protein A